MTVKWNEMGRLRRKGKGETGTDYWALVLALECGDVQVDRNMVVS